MTVRHAEHAGVKETLWCLELTFLNYVRDMLHSLLHCFSTAQSLSLNLRGELCSAINVSQTLGDGCGGREGGTFNWTIGRPPNSGLVNVNLAINHHFGRNTRLLLVLELFLVLAKSICFPSIHSLTHQVNCSKGRRIQSGSESLLLLSGSAGNALLVDLVDAWHSKILGHQALRLEPS
jgi:hypothetical protein